MPNFNGTAGDDIFTGGADNDTAVGNGGHDTLSGAGGSDLLVGNSGADTLNGGEGSDTLYSGDQSPPYNLPYYGNVYTPPLLDTGSEVDTLIGGGGDDRLFAGYGDNVDGGGNEYAGDYLFISFMGATVGVTADFRLATQVIGGGTITSVENISWVQGSDFADDINVESYASNGYSNFTAVFGMGGNDWLKAGYYTGTLFGGDGDDVVDGRGSQYLQSVDGGAGDDTLYTNSNTFASAYGGNGNDTIYSHGATFGGAGNDLIVLQFSYYGGQIFGEDGNDEIRASGSGNFIVGGAGADTLTGDYGQDTLFSADLVAGTSDPALDMGLERDRLAGFGGNDTLAAGYGDDADGGSGTDSLRLSLGGATSGVTLNTAGIVSGQPFVLGGGTINSIETLTHLRGSEFGDTLTIATQGSLLIIDAGAGDDLITSASSSVALLGGTGNDRFVSGAAGDTFDGGAGSDTIDYSGYATGVTVNVATGAGAGGDVLTAVENIIGSAFDDTLTGTAGDNLLNGGAGVDLANYAAATGGVTVSLSRLDAQITGGAGVDTILGVENLTGSAFNDILTGNTAANTLTGGSGNDRLTGRAGADNLSGGAGTDTADYGTAAGGVTANLGTASASDDGDGASDILSGFENLIGSGFGDVLIGEAGINVLTGGAGGDSLAGLGGADTLNGDEGDDLLAGGLGNDALNGGAGSDTADYSGAAAGILATLANGAVSDGDGGSDFLSGVESLIGSAFADTLLGDGAANALSGGGGDDLLRGGAGVDILNGGTGIDTVDYSTAAAGVQARLDINRATNDGDGGTDTFSGIENLTGSNFNDTLFGDGGANVLRGGTGYDVLLGLAGNDTLWGGSGSGNELYGGAGSDLYVLEFNDSVIENVGEGFDTVEARMNAYVLSANVENLRFGGTGSFAGTGNGLANTLTGGAGEDNLRGRGGADTLIGGTGIDTADYTLAAAGVVARLDINRATRDGDGSVDNLHEIENLIGSNFDDVLFGDNTVNVLHGGIGTDVLLGFGGDDFLTGGSGGGNNELQGGTGNDYYLLDAFDTCVEYAGEGIDTVEARIGSYTMGGNIEILLYTGPGSFVGNGNALDNTITGGAQNDILRGKGGNDTINGGAGNADEVQLRGLAAEYAITQVANTWQIVDNVAGRDGTTTVSSVEVLRFADNATQFLTYGAPAPLEPVDKTEDADAQVLPGLIDDEPLVLAAGFELKTADGLPEVQPWIEDDFVAGKGGDLPLVLPGEADLDGPVADRLTTRDLVTGRFALTLGEDGLIDRDHDAFAHGHDRGGWDVIV